MNGEGLNSQALAASLEQHLDLDLAVSLCQEVSRIPSILGEEGPLAVFLADVMRDLGFEGVHLQPVLPDRPNAIGHFDFGTGRKVVLTGHMDTKPVSRGWTKSEPFSGALIDGRVYGHGIMDMKAALVCQIVALAALARSGLPTAGRATMVAVSDHMGDQQGSIRYFDKYPADLCVLGELSDNEICLGHRGRYYFDITTHGRSAHTCHKHLAINANYLAALAVIQLDRSHLEPELDPRVTELFGSETYMSPGRIYGGLPPGGPSMIPDECVIRVDCRPQPGVTIETVRKEIDRCLDAAKAEESRFEATVELVDVKDGYLAPPESEVIGLMRQAVTGVTGVEDPPLVAASWLGDTASFGDKVPTVVFGPGSEPVYCPDENLPIEDIHLATRVYALFTALGLRP
jgi:acetylornithine deacetylase/succinyl-diaminopimelate desuccinylase-like protein